VAVVPGFRTIGSLVGRPLVRGRDPMGISWPDSVTGGRFAPGNASGSDDKMLAARLRQCDSGAMRDLGGIGALRRVFVSLEVTSLPIGGNLGQRVEFPWWSPPARHPVMGMSALPFLQMAAFDSS
jgi:hypothetical protein